MKNDVLRVKSLHVLQRLLAPLVARRISRKRGQRAAARIHTMPSPELLKSTLLFAKWLVAPLQNLIASGVTECHEKGTTVAFAGEPRRAADVFWLMSGKMAQIPNKAELRACASDLVHLPRDQPKTGPLILSSHFVEDSAKRSLLPLTAAQEHLADSLGFYHAGQLVDVERLLLGGERLRGLRCQTPVVVLRLSVAACLRELQALSGAAYTATIDAAREYVQRTMAQFTGVPSTTSIMAANPVLAALPLAVLRSIRLQLKPFVFLRAEAICANVFAADCIYILASGKVRIDDGNGAKARVVETPCTAIGVHAFVQCSLPDYFDQTLRATAAVYSEMWGIPLSALMSTCSAAARLPCTVAAAQLLRGQGTGQLPIAAALRTYTCFSNLSETAVVAIGRALQLRVYAPGETVVPAGRIPAFGILVIAGDVRVHRCVEREQKPLSPGQALFFCETLVKMSVNDSVVSHSSATVLLGTPGLLLEAMEIAGAASEDTQLLIRDAQAYVDHRYGAGQSEISKAQNAAAERVREYKRRQADEQRLSSASSPYIAAASAQVLQNELLASLEVQLQALHPSDGDATKFELFRATHATTCGAAADRPPPPRRSAEFFTLDEMGNLVTRSEAQQPPDGGENTPRGVERRVSLATSAVPPPTPPQRTNAVSARATATATPRSAPAVPIALRAAVRAPQNAAKPTSTSPSPRVASLRAAASRMKDVADGVDRRIGNGNARSNSTRR